MTTTRIYKSTDTSAPVLVGGVSSLINVLDKCLVAGYGSKSAAGWTKPFTGTNKAAFRNSVAAGGSGAYLRVDDSGAGTGGARVARCRSYLTMSDVDTGTIPTPTTGQLSAGIIWRKSDTVDSTPRAWIVVADERTVYIWVDDGGSADFVGAAGDFESFVPADPYAFFIAGRSTQEISGIYEGGYGLVLRSNEFQTPTADGFYLARGYAGAGSPVGAALASLASSLVGASSAIGSASGHIANPAPGSSALYWIPALICTEGTVRGRMRGCYVPVNTFDGVAGGTEYSAPPGLPSGANLVTLRHSAASSGDGHVFVDSGLAWQ